QQNRELVMTAMTSSPGSLSALPVRFGTLPSFRNDKEMIMFALSQDKGDAEFVWKAITLSAQGDRDIIRKTLSLFKTKDVPNFISRNLTQTYSNRPNVRVTIFELHPVHFSL